MKRTQFVAGLMVVLGIISGCSPKAHIPDQGARPDYQSLKAGEEGDEPGQQSVDGEPAKEEQPEQAVAPRLKAIGPVATVDGVPVTAQEFNSVVEGLVSKGVSDDQIRELKETLINGVVNDYLLKKKVETLNYPVSEERIQESLVELVNIVKRTETLKEESADPMQAIADQLGIERSQVREQIKQAIQLEIELEKKGYLKPVTSEEAEAFYNENPTVSERPELVTVRHILLKVEKGAPEVRWEERKKEALEIEKQAKKVVKKGGKKGAAEAFGTLAQEKSEGVTKSKGGLLGPIYRGAMVKEFETVAFSLKVGQVSDPVRTDFGWHIVFVEKREEARKVPFSELEALITSRLRRAKVSEQLVKYLEDRRAEAKIVLKPENVQ